VVVSHVVTDHSILDFITVRANLEKQALYGLFAFLLLLPAVFGPQDRSLIRRFLRTWPMASLGVISYGVYLWHLPLITEFLKWMGWQTQAEPFWLLASVILAMSIAFASASYFGLERPILRRKNRISWWDRRSSAPKDLPGSPTAPTDPLSR
jgi:peptidoglycan/LPS O-acetylase OafA/YrhL